MDIQTIALVIGALAVGAGIAWAFLVWQRRRHLKERFGPEYGRTLETEGDRGAAERELESREHRVRNLDIRPLPPDERDRFLGEWERTQARFVDDPAGALLEADHLVTEVMRARGYPVADFEQRAADVSVDHAEVVEHYRAARRVATAASEGRASTEDIRRAVTHYRALFAELLGIGPAVGADRMEAVR